MRSPREHWTCTRTVFHEMQSLRDGFFQEGEGEGESRILGLVMNLYPGPSLVHRGYYISKKFVKTSTKYLKATSWASSISRHGDDCSMSDRKTFPWKKQEVQEYGSAQVLCLNWPFHHTSHCFKSTLHLFIPGCLFFKLSWQTTYSCYSNSLRVYCHSIFPLSDSRGQLLSQ